MERICQESFFRYKGGKLLMLILLSADKKIWGKLSTEAREPALKGVGLRIAEKRGGGGGGIVMEAAKDMPYWLARGQGLLSHGLYCQLKLQR